MIQALLEFPDVESMARFIVNNREAKVEIDSFECKLKGFFSNSLIANAKAKYGAKAFVFAGSPVLKSVQ
jgi:hypothetical protein